MHGVTMKFIDKVLFKTMTQVKIKAITILLKTVQRKASVKKRQRITPTN